MVIFFFRREIRDILSALAKLDFKTENGKLIPLIIVGSVPAAAIGLPLENVSEQMAQNLAFIVCGTFLYLSKMGREKTDEIGFLTG
ncbi:MAG: hypothetical protein C0193_02425 [Candidatus Bathyarchaeota archaeon]|nr:MAG: hypothetical protein C0193_02425 [Candidatus Bathyarchaeota archaeon]